SARVSEFGPVHRVFDLILPPGAAFMEPSMAAAAAAFPSSSYAVTDLVLREPLILEENATRTLQVVISPADDGPSLCVFSRVDKKPFVQHASCKLRAHDAAAQPGKFQSNDVNARCSERLDVAHL